MKLIEADALKAWLKTIPLKDLSDGKGLCRIVMEQDFAKAIKNMPTEYIVDAVEVVRCKDCRHGKCVGIEYLCRAHSGNERKLGAERHYSEWHNGNWFCADGERKEESE